ncbi:serine/threonine-protein phosphatase 2A regulatory subunit B [Schistosoma bovis]|uniref:Serine/threonine-protein phosphatase 2A regulatory subunit B n=1 Tax=Schistosoma bovis TaxID=6184 RepID=A0A430Q6L9_SCHBO|nr:serine/threonine-protein phosphatase 2A regulatory subunit B [Schistosoma bovis]
MQSPIGQYAAPSCDVVAQSERTIKLWQLTELPTQSFTNLNFPVESGCRRKVVIRSLSDIKVPVCLKNYGNTNIRVQNKKVFARAHGFSIVGLSPSADRETFFSADPLRINMWNLEVTNEVFTWDSRMPTQPVEVYPVQRHLKKHLTVLYESELLFDDFKLTISSNDRYVSAWDSRMPTQPVEVYPVQRHLKKHLTVLYESELLFDDFKLTISSNDRYVSG